METTTLEPTKATLKEDPIFWDGKARFFDATVRYADFDHDFEAFFDIYKAAMHDNVVSHVGRFHDETQRDGLKRAFADGTLRIVEDQRRPVACIKVDDVSNNSFILVSCFAVTPTYQRSGLGKALMSRVFDYADLAQKDVYLTAYKNSDAVKFYEAMGFTNGGGSKRDPYVSMFRKATFRPPAL
jgi:GNAT superfamily N-acetyltransferase